MAHISEISSGTFTTLAQVLSTERPADAGAWLRAFRPALPVATGLAATAANINIADGFLTITFTGTGLPAEPEAGRTYRLATAADVAGGTYFRASEVSDSSTTSWTIRLPVPSTAVEPAAITGGVLQTTDGAGTVGNIREFPSLGTPANIVNVPVYGQSISSQVGGQADAPTLSFTLNYVPSVHAELDALRRDGTTRAWRVRLASAENGIRGNSFDIFDDFYFRGSVVSFEITPSLSDSNQATITVNITGDFAGPFSLVGTVYGAP